MKMWRGVGAVARSCWGAALALLYLFILYLPQLALMEITAERIVQLFEEDLRARKRLAELLISEPDIRLAIINAVLRDVATKQDIAELRRSLEAKIEREIGRIEREIERVEKEIDRLEREIDRLYRLVMISVLGILVSVATTVLVRVLLP